MRVDFNSEEGISEVYVHEQDLCYECELSSVCPLLGALQENYVYLAKENFILTSCPIKEKLDS